MVNVPLGSGPDLMKETRPRPHCYGDLASIAFFPIIPSLHVMTGGIQV